MTIIGLFYNQNLVFFLFVMGSVLIMSQLHKLFLDLKGKNLGKPVRYIGLIKSQ